MIVRVLGALLLIQALTAPPAHAGGRTSLAGAAGAADSMAAPKELVVLVHGLGRTSVSMVPLARELERQGYQVLNWGYSSLCCTVAELGAQLADDLRVGRSAGTERIHFIGHSLGNIVIRWVLAHGQPPAPVGKVVMLAPPNQGSHEADRFAPWLGWLLRPLPELRTAGPSTVRSLPGLASEIEVGIIAGRYDGKVSVAETRLPGQDDHRVVPATHSFLMFREDVQRLTLEFLRSGAFPRAEGV